MLIRTAAAAAVVLALAGCGGEAGRDLAAGGASRAGASLPHTCARVAAEIRDVDVVTLRRQTNPAHEAVRRLSREGDAQSRTALVDLATGLRRIDAAQRPDDRAAALTAWSRALRRLDRTCTAAGAPASD